MCSNVENQHQKFLKELHNHVHQTFSPVTERNILFVQDTFTNGFKTLLTNMLQEAFRLLGKPPCAFAWVGSGSFSRGEVLPFSDVEYVWLFEGDKLTTRWFFWALDKLIVAQIHCLGEPSGFHPDQYPEVSEAEGSTEPLPHGLQAIVNKLKVNNKAPEGVYTQVVSSLQGRIIFGDESLWEKYESIVSKMNFKDAFEKILFVSVKTLKRHGNKRISCLCLTHHSISAI